MLQEQRGVFFSVITTCYNSERTIERTIRSVLDQTYSHFQYIIVDGASTDGTLEIVEKYAQLYPEKIVYVSERDQGIYDGINKGIRLALQHKGEQLIGLVNSDDFYERDALEIMAEAYENQKDVENPWAIYYGMIRILEDGQERTVIMNSHRFLHRTMITHPSCFVTDRVYRELGLYALEYRSASDYEFMLRMFRDPKVNFVPVYRIISNFSLGGISDTKLGDHETKLIRYKFGYMDKKEYLKHMLSYYVRFWRK